MAEIDERASMSDKSADPLDQVAKALLDILHISVGFGIIAFQKSQVARREIEAELARRFPPAKP